MTSLGKCGVCIIQWKTSHLSKKINSCIFNNMDGAGDYVKQSKSEGERKISNGVTHMQNKKKPNKG